MQRSLVLLRSRGLAVEIPTDAGFLWQAGEPAAPFIELLTTKYHQTLRSRADWTMSAFGSVDEIALAATMGERVVSAIGVEVSE